MEATLALHALELLTHAAVRESMPDATPGARQVVAEDLARTIAQALGSTLEDLGRAAELGRQAPFSAPQPS